MFGAPLQISAGFASWEHYCTASSSGRQSNFAMLNIGRHLYSAGRPSGWALAHILVVFNLCYFCVLVFCVFVFLGYFYFVLSVPVQVIAWKDPPRNDLLCVERNVKHLLTHSLQPGLSSICYSVWVKKWLNIYMTFTWHLWTHERKQF